MSNMKNNVTQSIHQLRENVLAASESLARVDLEKERLQARMRVIRKEHKDLKTAEREAQYAYTAAVVKEAQSHMGR